MINPFNTCICTRSTCLFYSIRTYLQLKKQGYEPELVFTHWHFRVYLWTLKDITTFEFCSRKNVKHHFLFAMLHMFIPFRGKTHIYTMRYDIYG